MARPPVDPQPLQTGEEVDAGMAEILAITEGRRKAKDATPGAAPLPGEAPTPRRRGRPPKASNAVRPGAGAPPNPMGRKAWEQAREVEDNLYSRDNVVAAEAKGWLSNSIRALAETDPDKSFRKFMGALRPLMQGHCPLGEVHETIIKALLEDVPATILITSRNMGKSTIAGMWGSLATILKSPGMRLNGFTLVTRSFQERSKRQVISRTLSAT